MLICCTISQIQPIKLIRNDAEKRVDVLIDGKLFTSYLYPATFDKPVLYPVNSPDGITITRGYPINSQPGERVDHPHHYGIWFNHGNVNGLDFWNNSPAIPNDKKHLYGTIIHKDIISAKQDIFYQGISIAELITSSQWVDINDKVLINEETIYTFGKYNGIWGVMRTSNLTADKDTVIFGDTKEGLFAIRFCREFEDYDDKPKKLLNEQLIAVDTIVADNRIASGIYRNSEGLEKAEVWGKPTRWIKLTGTKDGSKITMAVLDHKSNIGYPAHSHARGYGLFGINDMGSSHFGDYPEFNYKLEPRETITFKHLFIITAGDLNDREMNQITDFFYDF
jgi:hypothetical protein